MGSKYSKIVSNFSYLSILQVSNLIIPLITYPYLIRVLGESNYGKVIYSQSILTYLSLIINFGFNISGTREISINRHDKTALSTVVSAIFQLKMYLFIIVCIFLFLFLLIGGIHGVDIWMYIFSIWICITEWLYPVWFFQGVELMRNITIIGVLNKLLVLILIFLLIKVPEDYFLVPLTYLVGLIPNLIISFYFLKKMKVRFYIQPFSVIGSYFQKSYVMGLSVGVNTIKTNLGLVLSKFLFSYSAVAYYDLAVKVINIVNSFLDLISQAIYPKMSISKDKRFLKRIVKISLIVSVILTFLFQVMGGLIINILGGENMKDSVTLLKILAMVFPVYILGALFGRNALIVHGYNFEVLKSIIFSGFFYILFICVNVFILDHKTLEMISWAVFLSFLIETIYRYFYCKKLKII